MELQGSLLPRLPAWRVEGICREVESHLRESAADFAKKHQLDEQQSQLAALEAYGSPSKIAVGYLGDPRRKFWGLPVSWWVVATAATILGCWDFHWMTQRGFFDNYGATWQNGLAGIIGLAALILFIIACKFGYRSFFLPLLGTVVAVSIGLMPLLSFCVVGGDPWNQGLSRFHLERDMQNVQSNVAALDRLERYITQGRTEVAAISAIGNLPIEYRDWDAAAKAIGKDMVPGPEFGDSQNGYVIPWGGVMTLVDGRMYGLSYTHDPSVVRAKWKEANSTLQSLRDQRQAMEGLLTAGRQAEAGRLFFFNPQVYTGPIAWTIVFSPVLFLIDGLIFALSRRRRAWPARVLAS